MKYIDEHNGIWERFEHHNNPWVLRSFTDHHLKTLGINAGQVAISHWNDLAPRKFGKLHTLNYEQEYVFAEQWSPGDRALVWDGEITDYSEFPPGTFQKSDDLAETYVICEVVSTTDTRAIVKVKLDIDKKELKRVDS
jgi:hypothetical protein